MSNKGAFLGIEAMKAVFANLPRKQILLGASILLGGLLVGSGLLLAQTPPHNSLSTCQRYANQWYNQQNPENFEAITLSESGLNEEKYEGKVGRQFVSTVLSGTGQWRYKGEKPSPVEFTCLLENDRKAVFFHAQEAQPADPAKACWDNFHPAHWSGLQTCLKQTLDREDTELKQLNTEAQTRAKKVDTRWPEVKASEKLSTSETQWQTYRDQECARREAFRTGGNHPDVARYECLLRKTDERIQDLLFETSKP